MKILGRLLKPKVDNKDEKSLDNLVAERTLEAKNKKLHVKAQKLMDDLGEKTGHHRDTVYAHRASSGGIFLMTRHYDYNEGEDVLIVKYLAADTKIKTYEEGIGKFDTVFSARVGLFWGAKITRYVPGQWVSDLEMMYDNLPNLLEEKKDEDKEKREKELKNDFGLYSQKPTPTIDLTGNLDEKLR